MESPLLPRAVGDRCAVEAGVSTEVCGGRTERRLLGAAAYRTLVAALLGGATLALAATSSETSADAGGTSSAKATLSLATAPSGVNLEEQAGAAAGVAALGWLATVQWVDAAVCLLFGTIMCMGSWRVKRLSIFVVFLAVSLLSWREIENAFPAWGHFAAIPAAEIGLVVAFLVGKSYNLFLLVLGAAAGAAAAYRLHTGYADVPQANTELAIVCGSSALVFLGMWLMSGRGHKYTVATVVAILMSLGIAAGLGWLLMLGALRPEVKPWLEEHCKLSLDKPMPPFSDFISSLLFMSGPVGVFEGASWLKSVPLSLDRSLGLLLWVLSGILIYRRLFKGKRRGLAAACSLLGGYLAAVALGYFALFFALQPTLKPFLEGTLHLKLMNPVPPVVDFGKALLHLGAPVGVFAGSGPGPELMGHHISFDVLFMAIVWALLFLAGYRAHLKDKKEEEDGAVDGILVEMGDEDMALAMLM